jgi:hypothetical protein
MMNKDQYRSAMTKIKASERFKENLEASMRSSNDKAYIFRIKKFAPVFAALILAVFVSTAIYPRLSSSLGSSTSPNGSQVNDKTSSTTAAGDFEILGEDSDTMACYLSIVYLDGYLYTPSEWLNYSRHASLEPEYEKLKDEKLGVVTLDLKGKRYTGTPPDFSSTHDVGTEIYAIKNVKKERAVLVVAQGHASIFYRERKAAYDEKLPLNINLAEVFKMMSDTPEVTSVELRSEENGSWLSTSEDGKLLSLINRELPGQQLLHYPELGFNSDESGSRIPVNVVFSDGAALHMQVNPELKIASVFGGFIKLSDELTTAIKEFSKKGSHHPSISNLVGYSEDQVSYLKLINYTNGDKLLCENPAWSRGALFYIFNYHRVEEAQSSANMRLVMTSTLGLSEDDSVTVGFHENSDKHIILGIRGKYYKPVKGRLLFEELESFLYNSTELGLKKQ